MIETTLNDTAIRKVLLVSLEVEHRNAPETLIVEELGLCEGNARIDIAVINEHMHGYEIKSDRDTLKRLPDQITIYSKILDKITIVAGTRHIKKTEEMVPAWWGISEAVSKEETLQIREIRPPKVNPLIDFNAVVQLLWRNEALAALESQGLARGVLSKPRQVLWDRLVENLENDELCTLVRKQLRARQCWRSDLKGKELPNNV